MPVQVHVSVGEELYRALRRTADEQGETVSTIVRRALRLYVNGHLDGSVGTRAVNQRPNDGRTDGRTEKRVRQPPRAA